MLHVSKPRIGLVARSRGLCVFGNCFYSDLMIVALCPILG